MTHVKTNHDTKNFFKLRCSSDERVSGTAYDFVCYFPNNILMNQISEIQLIVASFLNGFYNVSSHKGNNTFKILLEPSNVTETYVFEDGFYTATDISQILSDFISSKTGDVLVNQNNITKKLVFTKTQTPGPTYENITFLTKEEGSTISPTIGILNAYLWDNADPVYKTDTYADLNGETLIFIHSSDIGQDKTFISSSRVNVNSQVNGVFSVPISVKFGVYQDYYGHPEDRIIFGDQTEDHHDLHKIRFTLRGRNGRLLTELPTNHVTTLEFKAYYKL